MYIFTMSWLDIFQEKKYYGNSIWKSMKVEILLSVLIIYTFVPVWFVGGLMVFHFYLISTNQTTYENFRYRYDKNATPYNKGFLKNFTEVFFSKFPPSMTDFLLLVIEESIETGDVQNIDMNIVSPKRKVIDIEMGVRHSFGGNTTVPSILQDLDYGSVDGDPKQKDGLDNDISDRFSFPGIQQTSVSEEESEQKSNESYNMHVEEAFDDGRSSNGGTSALLDHHIHSQQT